jgi:hypothetical protein
MASQLSDGDRAIIEEAKRTNNFNIFTDYYFRSPLGGYPVFPSAKRYSFYEDRWTQLGKPESFPAKSVDIPFQVKRTEIDGQPCFLEQRGYLFLPWFMDFLRSRQPEKLIIGQPGVGKTQQVGIAALCMAAIWPNFRFLGVAPQVYQSKLMLTEIESIWKDTPYREAFVLPGTKGFKKTPQAKITLTNGSTLEFMNLEKDSAKNIQSWSGDWINIDEAGLLNDIDLEGRHQLEAIMVGVATRLRGTDFQTGRARLGWLTMITMAYPNDYIWQRYDAAASLPEHHYATKVFRISNPYLTKENDRIFEQNIPPGAEKMWKQLEPMGALGAEFSSQMIQGLFSEDLMAQAKDMPDTIISHGGVGIYHFEMAYQEGHRYVLAGDPGINDPPSRNSPCILVFDVTNFPRRAATLAAFWWGFPGGMYSPFIAKFKEYQIKYKTAHQYCGYDSTSSQKMLAELAWMSDDMKVLGLSFAVGGKTEYLTAAKLLLSKKLIRVPAGIKWFENQMKSYKLPDHKIAQDIVATFTMAARLMYPLYLAEYPREGNNDQIEEMARQSNEAISRYRRHSSREANRAAIAAPPKKYIFPVT